MVALNQGVVSLTPLRVAILAGRAHTSKDNDCLPVGLSSSQERLQFGQLVSDIGQLLHESDVPCEAGVCVEREDNQFPFSVVWNIP